MFLGQHPDFFPSLLVLDWLELWTVWRCTLGALTQHGWHWLGYTGSPGTSCFHRIDG